MARKKKNKVYGPVLVIAIMIVVIAILSFILNLIGFDSTKTIISNGTMETTLVTVRNLISADGLKFLIGKTVSNFRMFEPLVLLIISLLILFITILFEK